MLKFKVVVPSYGEPDWLERCLASIAWQKYKNYDVCVLDDASGSERSQKIIEKYCHRYGWKGVFNTERKGALHNIVAGIAVLNCVDSDVIFHIDGDDCLATEHAFQLVADKYAAYDTYLTYGQYLAWPITEYGISGMVPDDILRNKSYRQIPWFFSQPHTFKYFLWRQIRDQDLRDPSTKEYWRTCSDRALFYPLLEMAGSKIHYISDIIYIYNRGNPLCVAEVAREEQLRAARLICIQEKYATIDLMESYP